MTAQAVHWYDGMFFWPHHMQQADRFQARQLSRSQKFNVYHNWGLRSIIIDTEALKTGRFIVKSLEARLRDGTLVSVPEDGTLPPLDLKNALLGNASITILLAMPKLQIGKRNAVEPGAETSAAASPMPTDGNGDEPPVDARYRVDYQEVEDENSGDNPQMLQVRWPNLKLMLSTQTQAGYEVLPVARVKRSESPEALPELDASYIPPILSGDAWPVLQAGILQASFDRIGKKLDFLANEVVARNISFDTRHFGAPKRIRQLQALNEANAVLEQVAFVPGIHPLWSFTELCRIVGQLSIFGETRRVPPLPEYDHDDLGGCFYRVKHYLDALLDGIGEPTYQERPFVGEELRMQVKLEPEWLRPIWSMYIGVRSDLKPEECIRLLSPGQLDMKIGSRVRVDEIFARGERGLQFTHTPQIPQALPALPGLIYFQVNRAVQQAEWQNVEKSLTLAIRLNQKRIDGEIEGKHHLVIKKSERETTTMQFTLYLVSEEETEAKQ